MYTYSSAFHTTVITYASAHISAAPASLVEPFIVQMLVELVIVYYAHSRKLQEMLRFAMFFKKYLRTHTRSQINKYSNTVI